MNLGPSTSASSTTTTSSSSSSSFFLNETKPWFDVVLSVGGRPFPANKSVLAENSDYFKTILSYDSTTTSLTLPNVPADVFSVLLSGMYSGSLALNINNACQVMLYAQLLQMNPAVLQCKNFLLNHANCGIVRPIPSKALHHPSMFSTDGNYGNTWKPWSMMIPSSPPSYQNWLLSTLPVPQQFPHLYTPLLTTNVAMPTSETTESTEMTTTETTTTTEITTVTNTTSTTSINSSTTASSTKDTLKKESASKNSRFNLNNKMQVSLTTVTLEKAACDGPVNFQRVANPRCKTNCEEDTSDDEAHAAKESNKTDEVYQCLFCNHVFKSQYCYQKHKRRHLNPFTLDYQTGDSNKKKSLILKDINVQFFPCKICGAKFPSYYFVHKHKKMWHDEETKENEN